MLTPELAPSSVRRTAATWAERFVALSAARTALGEVVPKVDQRRHEKRLEALLERTARRRDVREPSPAEIEALVELSGARPEEEAVLTDPRWRATSREILRLLRRDAPDLGPSELSQAMRNAWVCLFFQDLAGEALRDRPSMRAYSLLYPLTDNLLDGGDLAADELGGFVERLGNRLARGRSVRPQSDLELPIWAQLDVIDAEYPPERHPQVRACLRAIHRAQLDGVLLQRHCRDSRSLLALSCAKGGTSVLTDAVLLRGEASPEVREFAFAYGVLLQLLDDFEDRTEDRKAERRTWFTEAEPETEIFRLWRFALRITALGPWLDRPRARGHAALAIRSSRLLLLATIARQPDFDGRLARWLERFCPVRFGWIRDQEARSGELGLSTRIESLLAAA